MALKSSKVAKPTANIDNWVLVRTDAGHFCLEGEVTNHHRQGDFSAARQRTSRVVLFDGDNSIAETMNTQYTLGKPLAAPKEEPQA